MKPFIKLYHGYLHLTRGLPRMPRNLLTTVLFLCAACIISGELLRHTGGENNSDLVFILAIMCISLLTDGYFYGIAASVVGALCINYFFMFPFRAFSLSISGYPVTMLSMVAISAVICALTGRIKAQAIEATRREQDTKALYELNAKLNEEKAAIQLQADRETIRGNILRAVSHDLRTPLTAICGYLELLRREDASPQIRRYLSQVEGRVEAMKELTQELFRYSVTVSLPEAAWEPVDLRGALEESLLSFYGAFQQRGIQPQVALPEGPVIRPLDRGSLSRVLSNLISNALKYSGGDLQVSLEETGALSFSNTAPGLDAVSAGRLFDRFYTVEAGRHATGLGLSIAKLLTERMGGTIQARFRDGRLTIILTFPEARS